MPDNKIQILSTRIIGQPFTNLAAAYAIQIDQVPFIHTGECITPAILEKIQKLSVNPVHVIFSSINAVKVISKMAKGNISWKIFCVGSKTKAMAESVFGGDCIIDTANSAEELSGRITRNRSIKEIFFFCGNLHRKEFSENLEKEGIKITEIIVYKTQLAPQTISKKYDGLLFFSPSSVKSFFSKNTLQDKTQIFAIGATTANEVKLFSNHPVIIPGTPSIGNVVSMVITTFSKTKNVKCKI